MNGSEIVQFFDRVTEKAHSSNLHGTHSRGFCLMCAEIYVALNVLALEIDAAAGAFSNGELHD